ncbi:uncharacterized protein LOC119587618 [Penaeus monodon]|uniref:uncharacterized protein LOC119587618 n=1 Tax=Penaeus monodon TaxID=6687 RepID=UPI0018A6FABD|nr:uncharacterized protein LOC119587618 [Penaeus monodon]
MHQFLCSSDKEDIVEHVVDEVEDAYSPHESEEEPSSDGEEFPDDTVVLELYPKNRRRKFSRLYWEHIHSRDEAPTVPIYDVSDRSEIEEGISLLVKLFRRFFSDELLDMVVQQSNQYAVQQNTNKPLRGT